MTADAVLRQSPDAAKPTPDESALRYLDSPSAEEVAAASSTTYQIETQALWDARDEENLMTEFAAR